MKTILMGEMNTNAKSQENEYNSEIDLVEKAIALIEKPRNPLKIKGFAQEFNYLSGKTDIIAVTRDKSIISIEAKLSKWKIAIQQAHKNISFSHYSFVLLPLKNANQIFEQNSEEFKKRGIGLITIEFNRLKILIESNFHAPARPWLTDSAILHVENRDASV